MCLDYDEGDKGDITLADYKRWHTQDRKELRRLEAEVNDLKSKLECQTSLLEIWHRSARQAWAEVKRLRKKPSA